MMTSSLRNRKSRILHHLEWSERTVWSRAELEDLLGQKRQDWQIAAKFGAREFIDFLVEEILLARQELSFSPPMLRYCFDSCPAMEMAMSLRPNGYLSHRGAMRLQGLIPVSPSTVYVNVEQAGDGKSRGGQLSQDRIDAAFRHPARVSNNRAIFRNVEICFINGRTPKNSVWLRRYIHGMGGCVSRD
jgi:hypothetical protein